LVSEYADNAMDRYDKEATLSDVLSDPITLALMDADGVDPRNVAATLSQMAGKLALGSKDQKNE
jgi:hypothetical protein